MQHIKKGVALTLALVAAAPAAAQAKWAVSAHAAAPARDLRFEMTTSSLAGTTAPAPQVATDPAPDGFDWGDAGIGAAGGLCVSAVAVGGALVIVGRRRRYAPAR